MTIGEVIATLTVAASKKGDFKAMDGNLMTMEVESIKVIGNSVHLSFADWDNPDITITWGD